MLEQKLWSLQEKKKNHSPLLDRQKICSIGNQAISQRPREISVTEPEICPKEAHGTSWDAKERGSKASTNTKITRWRLTDNMIPIISHTLDGPQGCSGYKEKCISKIS